MRQFKCRWFVIWFDLFRVYKTYHDPIGSVYYFKVPEQAELTKTGCLIIIWINSHTFGWNFIMKIDFSEHDSIVVQINLLDDFMECHSIGLFSSHESSQWLFLVSVLDIIIWPIFVVFIHTSTIYFINNYKIRSHKIKSDNPVCQHSLLFIIIITIMIFSSVQADWIAAEFVKPVQTRFGKKCSVLINLWTRR